MTQSNESRATSEPAADAADGTNPGVVLARDTVTRINPKWLRNMSIYIVLLLGLGIWGLVDALVVYPGRGSRAAEFYEYQYLDELSNAAGSFTNTGATVTDPEATLARLKGLRSEAGKMSTVESAQLNWLTQLHLIGHSKPDDTKYPRTDFRHEDGKPVEVASVNDRLAALRTKWTKAGGNSSGPSPLDWYDIPTQWIYVALGLGLAPYLLMTVMKVRARVYRFDHATNTLTLPNGESITPADIKEFDKTKWDKVFITLHIRDDHPQLPGKALELDLLRFVPLESWVLHMEEVKGAATP